MELFREIRSYDVIWRYMSLIISGLIRVLRIVKSNPKKHPILPITLGLFSQHIYPWISLVEGDEGCIGPSGKLLC